MPRAPIISSQIQDLGPIPTMDEYIATLRSGKFEGNVCPPQFKRLEKPIFVERLSFWVDGVDKHRDCYVLPFCYAGEFRDKWYYNPYARICGCYMAAGLQVLQTYFLEYLDDPEDVTVYNSEHADIPDITAIYFRHSRDLLPIGKMNYYIEALHTRAEINFDLSLRKQQDPSDMGRGMS